MSHFETFCYYFFIFHIIQACYNFIKKPASAPYWFNDQWENEYPLCLKVTGFPLLFLGFNGLYYRSQTILNGAPVYQMGFYFLWKLIAIRPVNMYKNQDGYWKFQFADCYQDISFIRGNQTHKPTGDYCISHSSGVISVKKAEINFTY